MTERKLQHYSRHRTILANDRTFLAYARTSLTLFVAGATFIRFFDVLLLSYLGAVFIIFSIMLFVLGVNRFNKTVRHIKNVK